MRFGNVYCSDIVSKSRAGSNATALATYETFKALPSPQQPYTQYDFSIMADTIRTAESNAARARLKGTGADHTDCCLRRFWRETNLGQGPLSGMGYRLTRPALPHNTLLLAGSGLVTLQTVLKAYEAVLPKYGISPDQDTFYYRLLLKLSLDGHPDWWQKLNREALVTGRCAGEGLSWGRRLVWGRGGGVLGCSQPAGHGVSCCAV